MRRRNVFHSLFTPVMSLGLPVGLVLGSFFVLVLIDGFFFPVTFFSACCRSSPQHQQIIVWFFIRVSQFGKWSSLAYKDKHRQKRKGKVQWAFGIPIHLTTITATGVDTIQTNSLQKMQLQAANKHFLFPVLVTEEDQKQLGPKELGGDCTKSGSKTSSCCHDIASLPVFDSAPRFQMKSKLVSLDQVAIHMCVCVCICEKFDVRQIPSESRELIIRGKEGFFLGWRTEEKKYHNGKPIKWSPFRLGLIHRIRGRRSHVSTTLLPSYYCKHTSRFSLLLALMGRLSVSSTTVPKLIKQTKTYKAFYGLPWTHVWKYKTTTSKKKTYYSTKVPALFSAWPLNYIVPHFGW